MDKALAKLAENTPLALIILGGALLIVAAAGAVPFTQLVLVEPGWRLSVAVVGILLITFAAVLLWSTDRNPERAHLKTFQAEITFPKEGDLVDRNFNISGTYNKRLPNGYVIGVVEFDGARQTYRPRRIAIVENAREWKAMNVFSGEKPGEEKLLLVGLMGPAGQVVFDYWERVGEAYNYKGRPSIVGFDKMFQECGRIRVRVK